MFCGWIQETHEGTTFVEAPELDAAVAKFGGYQRLFRARKGRPRTRKPPFYPSVLTNVPRRYVSLFDNDPAFLILLRENGRAVLWGESTGVPEGKVLFKIAASLQPVTRRDVAELATACSWQKRVLHLSTEVYILPNSDRKGVDLVSLFEEGTRLLLEREFNKEAHFEFRHVTVNAEASVPVTWSAQYGAHHGKFDPILTLAKDKGYTLQGDFQVKVAESESWKRELVALPRNRSLRLMNWFQFVIDIVNRQLELWR